MNRRRVSTSRLLLLALLVLALNVGPGQAQGPDEGLDDQKVSAAADISPVINYQGKLFQDGSPAEGTRSMTFRLFEAASGGTALWTEGPKSVTVSGGVFATVLGDVTTLDVNDFDRALWLEVEVAGTTLPRQRLMGAPYAFSLAPGGNVKGTIDGSQSVLFVDNLGSGYGLLANSWAGYGVYARTRGTGADAAALYAWATTAGGVAIKAESNGVSPADATLVLTNTGAGDLIRGYGGDGGGDEFRVGNDGAIQSRADTYLFVPGNAFVKNTDADDTHWDSEANGAVIIWSTGGAASRAVYLPISLPGVLYGQPVEVKSITIYYRCQSGTNDFITSSHLYVQTDADNAAALVSDETDRKSTVATSYTLLPTGNNVLSDAQGILTLLLYLDLDASPTGATNYVRLGGARLQLGHHN